MRLRKSNLFVDFTLGNDAIRALVRKLKVQTMSHFVLESVRPNPFNVRPISSPSILQLAHALFLKVIYFVALSLREGEIGEKCP